MHGLGAGGEQEVSGLRFLTSLLTKVVDAVSHIRLEANCYTLENEFYRNMPLKSLDERLGLLLSYQIMDELRQDITPLLLYEGRVV
jgi:hypothetical protein